MPESGNEMVSYRRTQKGPWGLLLYAGAVILLTVTWSVPNVSALPIALGVIGFVVLGTSFHQLTVVDEGRQLVIHFGPLPLFRRRIWYQEIVDAEQGRTTLLDGWGIHWTPWSGWVWKKACCLKSGRAVKFMANARPNYLVRQLRLRVLRGINKLPCLDRPAIIADWRKTPTAQVASC